MAEIQWNSYLDLGIKANKEGAGGSALGLFWIPSALNPHTVTRSYSKTGHHDPAAPRENYHLLTGHRVRDIVLDDLSAVAITIQSRNASDTTITTITAKQEIVLAAGAFGSPTLLQRSGIGPKEMLEIADIEVKLDLPGVGRNLQDHAATFLLYDCV